MELESTREPTSNSARISEEAVAHVARLARLHVTPQEQKMFSQQLSSVLDHGQEMENLNLADVPPTSHPYQLKNVLRADEASAGSDRDEVLAAAPEAQDDQFRVPPVLEQA